MLLVSATFILSIYSTFQYYTYHHNNNNEILKSANNAFRAVFYLLVLIGILLFLAIVTHNFSFEYVSKYSSTKEEWYYLISTFWAGQEGTFYLWLLYTVIFGLIIIKRNDEFVAEVMVFLNLTVLFLSFILITQSPFRPLDPEILANLEDGRGLNPLLKNPWMVIHPPTLFLGYSSVVVPSAYALAGLWKRKTSDWIKYAFPWTLFSTAILGLGIIMGGYWAYVVLGWGGYWAWDPVENASAFPWFIIVACFHSMIIFRAKKAYLKTVVSLAMLSYFLMLYGSFLTRSGVLAEFSVHSFSSLGLNAHLIGFVVLYVVICLYFFFSRLKEMPSVKIEDKFSKEMILSFIVVTFVLSTFAMFIGTSIPLFTIFADKQLGAAQPEQYNYVFSYVAVLIMLFLALGPTLKWKKAEISVHKYVYAITIACSVAVTVIIWILYPNLKIQYYLVYLTGTWALLVNLYNLKKNWKSPTLRASATSHIGMALMFIGIMTSSTLGETDRILLEKGVKKDISGLNLTYESMNFDEEDENSIIYKVKGENKSEKFTADLVFTYSSYNNGTMRKPYIQRGLASDLYFSPVNQYEIYKGTKAELKKLEHFVFNGFEIKFEYFDVLEMNQKDNIFRIKANFSYKGNNKAGTFSHIFEKARGTEYSTVKNINDINLSIKLLAVNAATKSVNILYGEADKNIVIEQLEIELSEKPLIMILWIGTIILVIGVMQSVRVRKMGLIA